MLVAFKFQNSIYNSFSSLSFLAIFLTLLPGDFSSRDFFNDSMDRSTEGTKVDWMSVPAFGDWDNQKGMPDYSLDFSKLRQMRKQNKSDYSSISIGNDEDLRQGSRKDNELHNQSKVASAVTPTIHQQHSPSGRRKFMSYFVCCTKA